MNNNPQPHHMLVLAAAILTAIAVCASAVESQDLQHGIGTMTDLSPVADAGLPSLSSAGRRNNADDATTTPPLRRRQPIPAGLKNELAFALAKVAANEGALINPDEPKLIWQTALSHSDSTEGRYRWLRRHSGRVFGAKTCKSGNCLWTRNLKLNPFYQPREASHVAADYWREITAPRWARILKLSADLVYGRVEVGWEPCDGKPITWGSRDPELPDVEHARSMGLVALNCEGTLNDGYAAGDAVNRGE